MQHPLTKLDLFPCGPLHRLGRRVELLSETDSTNAYLLARVGDFGDGAVAAAEFQTAGRGRQGRRWLAPRGSSILLSVLLIEPEGSLRIMHAAMLGALAACEAVEAETECRPGLRWPNDLMVGDRKLGGVLAESSPLLRPPDPRRPSRSAPQGREQGRRALVIGVGLNCFQQSGHFGPELAETATSLEIECARPVDRVALARRLLERLDAHLSHAPHAQRAWEELRRAWAARCDDFGTRVSLEESSRRYTGTVLEITDNGDLLVQLDSGGRKRFESTTTTRIQEEEGAT